MGRGQGGLLVLPDIEASDSEGALLALARAFAERIPDGEPLAIARCFGEREGLGTTAIGGGVALPHCRWPEIDEPLVVLARSRMGIPFGATDGEPVRLFVAVVTPSAAPAEHLRALAGLARRLRDRGRVADLLAASDATSMLAAWLREAGEAA